MHFHAGYRYYCPSLGRFINRDPQNELGRIQLVSFGGRGVQVWSYLGLASANGAEAAQKQDAFLQNTSLPHSNEQVSAGPKNSLIPGMTDFSKKGYSVGAAAFRTPALSLGGDNSYYAPYQSGMGNDVGGDANPYTYVGNSPYSAIDPLGLWSWNWVPNWLNGMFSSGYSGPTYMSPSGRYSFSPPGQGPNYSYLGLSREITGEPYDTTQLKNATIPLRIAADNYPGIGTANTAYTAFTGKDAITRETVATEDRWMASAATAGTVLGPVSAALKGGMTAESLVGSGKAYSVAYQMKMQIPAVAEGTRSAHFRTANASLFASMDANPAFARAMQNMIPGINSSRGTAQAPNHWVWNHLATEPGVMQLVPSAQHWSPNPLWSLFHPKLNGKNLGGFKIWGHLY